ncbi:MAG: hypothetical protein JSS63_05765 [Bacteroidetes bacterium]|nr:hypothetical protein [Bacteroidota bacterium]
MLKKIFLILIIFLPVCIFAQELYFREVCRLPAKIDESSGIEINSRGELWSFNDSGGEPEIYRFDTLGNILRTVVIRNAVNIDWEEIRQDDKGNFYICDFGNNDNERKNLRIYKIPNPTNLFNDTVDAEVIKFSYPDQKEFPPSKEKRNFDMESAFCYKDSIYLFSKNRTEPYSGFLRVYTLPAKAGDYTARLIDSIYIGTGPFFADWITSADISPDYKSFVLLSNNKFWLFKIKEGVPLTKSEYVEIFLPEISQKEGICYVTPDELYITDELYKQEGGKLYVISIKDFLAK